MHLVVKCVIKYHIILSVHVLNLNRQLTEINSFFNRYTQWLMITFKLLRQQISRIFIRNDTPNFKWILCTYKYGNNSIAYDIYFVNRSRKQERWRLKRRFFLFIYNCQRFIYLVLEIEITWSDTRVKDHKFQFLDGNI